MKSGNNTAVIDRPVSSLPIDEQIEYYRRALGIESPMPDNCKDQREYLERLEAMFERHDLGKSSFTRATAAYAEGDPSAKSS